MAKCLVTGGAGFIGSHIVRKLLKRGDQVIVLDNFSSGQPGNLADLGGPLEILEGDVRHKKVVEDAVRGVDFIFHQAAFVSVPMSMRDPQACFDINVQGTLNLFEAARKARVQQLVLASSAAVYGDSPYLPLREACLPAPLSPYAASKLAGEVYATLFTKAFDLPVVALRYFNIYGPRQSPFSDYAAVIPIFIRRKLEYKPPTIFGDGFQRRDFVYVSDVVRANLLAAENPRAAGRIINICSGHETTLIDLLEILDEILPGGPAHHFAPERPGDIYRSLGDPSSAYEVIGFSPQIGLAEGLLETVEWMRF